MGDESIGIGILGTAAIARKNIRAIKLARNGLGEPFLRLSSHAIGATVCASALRLVVYRAKEGLRKAQGSQTAAVDSPKTARQFSQALACAAKALLAKSCTVACRGSCCREQIKGEGCILYQRSGRCSWRSGIWQL